VEVQVLFHPHHCEVVGTGAELPLGAGGIVDGSQQNAAGLLVLDIESA
jgi:hypothetical protein